MGELVHMFPDHFQSFHFLEGQNFDDGSVVQWKYHLGEILSLLLLFGCFLRFLLGLNPMFLSFKMFILIFTNFEKTINL